MALDVADLGVFERRAIDEWQSGFPLMPRPYAAIGSALGVSEDEAIARLTALKRCGAISRIGAALTPNTAGASTLAAMRVPPERLEEVAAIVSSEQGVNHNYEREHAINLWFVVTGASRACLARTIERIEEASGLGVISLPLEKSYFINLGFPMVAQSDWKARGRRSRDEAAIPVSISERERLLLTHLEDGKLELVPRPYAVLAERSGMAEAEVLVVMQRLVDIGVISRFGLILRHRALGYRANAMAVWDVPDETVERVGRALAEMPQVTLCYRRPRRFPEWRYNLFCMVHGRARDEVMSAIAQIIHSLGIEEIPHAVLFSRRCFKQRGATLAVS